jgi:transposase
MMTPPSGVRVWLAAGTTDMRRGMNGLALQVQQALQRDPHAGDVYVFRGRRGDHTTLCIPPVRYRAIESSHLVVSHRLFSAAGL